MIRNLTAEENLERKRYNLSKALNKPVYICSTLNKHGTHYKRPGEEHYETIGRLEAFLSQWSDGGFCKKREEENFYYDLSPASVLYLAYPLKKKEDVDRESIQLINLQHSLNERVVVYLGAEEKVPRELTEYVDEYRLTSHKKRIGICFARSEPICTPAELQKDWHLGFTTDKLVTLQGPGWYSVDQYRGGSGGRHDLGFKVLQGNVDHAVRAVGQGSWQK